MFGDLVKDSRIRIVTLFGLEFLTVAMYLFPELIDRIILVPNLGSICPTLILSESRTFTILLITSRIHAYPGLSFKLLSTEVKFIKSVLTVLLSFIKS